MSDVVVAAREALEAHDVRHCSVCIALSGGLDSVVLLEVINELAGSLGLAVSALHVNHGLHEQAAQWAQYCRQCCDRLGVALTVDQVTVSRHSGLGIEAAARAQRYAAFARVRADYLALAHHLDDQVETFVMQLLRGAGTKGLSAMPVERPLGDHGPALLRPFLSLTRAQLAQYAAVHKVEWVEDASNAEQAFDRNFLRHAVLPVIEQRFPAYRTTVSRASRNLAEASELTEILGVQDLDELRINGGGLDLGKLRTWPLSRALNAVRCLLLQSGCATPGRDLLVEALRQAFEARQDARVRVDFGGFSLRRYRRGLFVVRNLLVPPGWQGNWRGESELALPPGLGALRFRRTTGCGLSARLLQDQHVRIAFRAGGERIALACNRPHRDLKKLFQEAGMAPWQRERTPLLFSGTELALVPGLGIAGEFQAKPGDDSWDVEWVQT